MSITGARAAFSSHHFAMALQLLGLGIHGLQVCAICVLVLLGFELCGSGLTEHYSGERQLPYSLLLAGVGAELVDLSNFVRIEHGVQHYTFSIRP